MSLRHAASNLVYSAPAVSLYWTLFGGRLRSTQLKTVLILSHMRSGSSLLVHLLNTNPKVFGFGETFLDYGCAADLRQLPLKVLLRTGRALRSQEYAVDKLLHPRLITDPAILSHPDVVCLFLLRDPDASMRSLIRAPSLPGWSQSPGWDREHVDPEVVAGYYCGRLASLADYARGLGDAGRSLFVTYEEMLSSTAAFFAAVQCLLDLGGAFSEDYPVLGTTGRPGIGDPSEHIKKGSIDRTIERPDVVVREDILARARTAYRDCVETLRGACDGVTANPANQPNVADAAGRREKT